MRLTKALPQLNLLFSLFLAAVLIVLVVQGRHAQATRNEGLRTFICYFDSAVLKFPQTPARRQKAIRFFNGLMVKLNEPPCSSA